VAGAKALAVSVLDFIIDRDLVAQTKASFRHEIGDVTYRPLLPDDQRPPVDLNRAEMEKYRPLMERHYVKERPVFSL
jgi:aminobenzoyl-glutamate utilization protein B